MEKALKLAYEIKGAAPDQEVILTVHELKRLARNAAELMILSNQLQTAGVQLELLTGPLIGIYDPNGMGAMFFAVLAVAAQLDRNYIREKTLEGQHAAANKGNHGGRPKVIDDDMLLFARALKDKGVPVPEIAKKLTIKTGKNAGQRPSVASVYRALADAEEADAPAGPEIGAPRRPTRVDLTGPGSGTDRELMERLTRQALTGDNQVLVDLVRQAKDGTNSAVLADLGCRGEDGSNDVVAELLAQARKGGSRMIPPHPTNWTVCVVATDRTPRTSQPSKTLAAPSARLQLRVFGCIPSSSTRPRRCGPDRKHLSL
ncbi:recombinase family protein [Streptomyces halobius]|uniref:Recombinase family protein n=1 Tax=Streptomyces halobius TaxID=2879846 RepID=A0ABY4MFT7_9ACTN|nr:recombinase family protein [Streptomyces halobius]UQA96664.1 recombinase family protein [Streptomyces halobius]